MRMAVVGRLVALAVVLVAVLSGQQLAAQVVRTIGVVPTSNAFPFNASTSMRYQVVYTAAECNVPAGSQLTEIRVYKNNALTPANLTTYNNFRLRVGHSTFGATGITTTYDTNYIANSLVTCIGDPALPGTNPVNFLPTSTIVGAVEWVRFPFTTNFSYNGTDSILVDWSFDSKIGTGFQTAGSTRTRAFLLGGNASSPMANNTDAGGNWMVELYFNVGPSLALSAPTLNLGATPAGTAGNPVSYTVAGNMLTAATNITAPAGVEISFAQATGYGSSLQITTTPAYPATTIYARIAATAPVGPLAALNIVHESTGAPTQNLALSGNVVSLQASAAALNAGFTTINNPGNPVSFDLTAAGLINATLVTVPTGFEVAAAAAGPYAPTLNIPTMPGYVQTVYVRLDGVVVGSYAGDVSCASAPAAVLIPIVGDTFPPDNLHAQRHGPGTTQLVDNNSQGGDNGLVLLDFSLGTINAAWTATDLTFSASGSANEQSGISSIALYEDSTTGGTGGVFDGPFVDTLATTGAGVSFNGPNGDYVVTLTNTAFPVFTSRRFFLVVKLAGTAVAGETFKAELTAVAATTGGTGQRTGLPTGHPADAFMINTAEATITLSGPVVYTVVNNNDQGPGAVGRVVCDFRISPKNDAWTVNSLTFTHGGTMDGQADINFLGLYLDDGDGVWEGSANDIAATAATGVNFNAPNGNFVAGLTAAASAFGVNQVKRFFLVARLAGSASTGETLRVRISAINHNAPTGGAMVGVPTGNTSALVIDQPTLTVNAGPANPTVITREKSAAGFTEMIGALRLSASNSAFAVTGLTLHTGGNGDWLNHLDAAGGMQVFRDNGNGSFDVGDVQLFAGPAATPATTCAFTTTQNVAMSTDMDLWIVLNVLPGAGASPYETFTAAIKTSADVSTGGGTVKIGTLAPQSGELRVVDFSVSSFTPTVDLFAGGGSVKIEGSGFALPVTVTIGGVACTGSAVVNPQGTLISGLGVPSGTGSNLAIVLTTNNLPPRTLTQTFRYSSVLAPNTGTGAVATETSCSASAAAPLGILALPVLALFGLRRRRE